MPDQITTIRFTFLWLNENRWEGKDYKIGLQSRANSQGDERVPPKTEHRKSRKKAVRKEL
jgi:hypothetical protein